MNIKRSFHIFSVLLSLTLWKVDAAAQISYRPYSYQHYQKYNRELYSPHTREHTAVKQYVHTGRLQAIEDSLHSQYQIGGANSVLQVLFNEHQLEYNASEQSFYVDYLPNIGIGSELISKKRTVWDNSHGLQAGYTWGDKLSLYVNGYKKQAVFPAYMDDYITENELIPGQGSAKMLASNKKDWWHTTANITYHFSDYIQATIAYDKNHIGDGYRSVLLSDFSDNYAQLKLTGKIGNVQYTSIWSYMNDPSNPRRDALDAVGEIGDGRKWGVFQYLDYNVTNRLSLGFFQSVTWANKTAAGHRGFDFNYLNPVIFLRPVESNNASSPDKMAIGLNAKYKTFDNVTVYGQFLLNEFTAKEFFGGNGYAHNKWATQIGAKSFDVLGIENLNLLAEYNVVRPYTFQHFSATSNYSNNGEPLAHPYGANFKEILAIANYSYKRFDFSAQGLYALIGTDPDPSTNMGGDIFQSYRTIVNMYGNHIGQGTKNNLYFIDLKAAYLINPKYNLRLELGYTQRYRRIEASPTQKSGALNIGLKSSFSTLYTDI